MRVDVKKAAVCRSVSGSDGRFCAHSSFGYPSAVPHRGAALESAD